MLAIVRDGRERSPSMTSALVIFMVLVRDGQGGNERVSQVPIDTTGGMLRKMSCCVVDHVHAVFLQYTVGHDMTTELQHGISFPSRAASAALNC